MWRLLDNMKVFVVYESRGCVWGQAFSSFEDALAAVSKDVADENQRCKDTGFYEHEKDRPAKMEDDITPRHANGGVLVAFSDYTKRCTYIKELTL